jgi:hypothetical protein
MSSIDIIPLSWDLKTSGEDLYYERVLRIKRYEKEPIKS